jgi:hypothetical protein
LAAQKDVDGRVKPGHDGTKASLTCDRPSPRRLYFSNFIARPLFAHSASISRGS